MVEEILSWAALIILATAGTMLLVSRDWRWSLALLAALYLGSFLLVSQYWPIAMAAAKLITGWMAIAALGMTRLNLEEEDVTEGGDWRDARPFRLLGAAIVMLIAVAAAPRIEDLVPGISQVITMGSLILVGMGLLQLGMTTKLLPVITGLLSLLAGFETLYAAVESSILVAGLLSVVNLSLALSGSYLLINSSPAEQEEEIL
jgi:hypothetical protein